jgi:hypothetical protein
VSRRATAILTAAVLALTVLPYLYARISTPSNLVYTGLMFDVPDHAQYWSWITASRDSIFITNTMTPEENAAIFANPPMWALAQAQTIFGLSFPALFQWWRVLAIGLLVPALVAFVRTMLPEQERRTTALVIALLGSGFGWLLIVAKKIGGFADVPWPTDLYTVEPNTFWSMLAYPHIALAQALILATMIGSWLAYRKGGLGYWLLAAFSAAALSVSHAYDLITIYAVLGVYGVVTWIRDRRFPARLTAAGLVVLVCSGPAALYYQRLTANDPLWRAVLSQYSNAGVWTPPHLHLIILMGAPLLLALAGAMPATSLPHRSSGEGTGAKAGWSEERWFVLTWAATGLLLIYLPVVFQIKLLSGWQFPIAVLAAHGWHERMWPALIRKMSPRPAFALLLLLVSSTNLYLFAWRFTELRRHSAPYYLHHDQLDVLAWLAQHAGKSDVVLAQPELGQFVPNYGGSRAYLAHWAMTNRFFERRANVERFFQPTPPDDWRERLLTAEHVTFVVRTDWPDQSRATFDPNGSPGFELVFARPRAQIYRFHPPEFARWRGGH